MNGFRAAHADPGNWTEACKAGVEQPGEPDGVFNLGFIYVTSALAGAATLAQLTVDLASRDLILPDEVLAGIEATSDRNPNPCP